MKKQILTLVSIFISSTIFACSCEIPKLALEFYSSEYVFEGNVISKVYAKDFLTYTVTFKITKHYKESNNPKTLNFTFKSEGEYTGVWTSCDWNVKVGEKWLVFAKYQNNNLTFGYFCSNSRPIGEININEYEQRVLQNGNSFKLEKYIYRIEGDFNYTKPISNVDSIVNNGKIKNYENPHTYLSLFINDKGQLVKLTTNRNYEIKMDSTFYLPTEFDVAIKNPLTEFQIDALELVSQISIWEIKRHKKTNIPVNYLIGASIEYNNETRKWKFVL